MKNIWETITGHVKPIPVWIKNSVFILISIGFLITMIVLAIDKEYDKLIVTCSLVVTLCASNIFNIRAEIEKYQSTLALEKKHETYSKIIAVSGELAKITTILKSKDCFNILSIEEKIKKVKELEQRYNEHLTILQNTINCYRLYCSYNMQVIIAKFLKEEIIISLLLNKPKNLQEQNIFYEAVDKTNSLLNNLLKTAQEELSIR